MFRWTSFSCLLLVVSVMCIFFLSQCSSAFRCCLFWIIHLESVLLLLLLVFFCVYVSLVIFFFGVMFCCMNTDSFFLKTRTVHSQSIFDVAFSCHSKDQERESDLTDECLSITDDCLMNIRNSILFCEWCRCCCCCSLVLSLRHFSALH